jgi:hypothetical protein
MLRQFLKCLGKGSIDLLSDSPNPAYEKFYDLFCDEINEFRTKISTGNHACRPH